MLKPDWSAAPRDARLDAFRDCLAEMTIDGRSVGYLATQVDAHAEYTGWLWWRRWSAPREFLVCQYERTAADSALREWADWWLFPEDADNLSMIEQLRSGRLEEADFREEAMARPPDERSWFTYSLRWLKGDEYDALWPQFRIH